MQMAPRFIFGAGEQADHVLRLLEWMGARIDGIELFDDGFPAKERGAAGLPVIGTIADGERICGGRREPVHIAIGTKGAAFRYALYLRLKAAGVSFVSVVSPLAHVAPTAQMGENVVVMPGCVLSKNVSVGCVSTLFANVTLEHDTEVGENVFIGPGAVTAGHARIGRHAFIGAGAIIGPGVRIGDRALVGAGAVVMSDLPDGMVAVGVPARSVRVVCQGDDAPTLEELTRWTEGPLR
jgi:sugar O-acyltransferase (sialic acid O-acetyltransferase NeuD family)